MNRSIRILVGAGICGAATFAASGVDAHTAGARCDGPNAVFTASLYGGADTHPRYILDGGTPVPFVGGFTKTIPNASTPHSMTVKADDWPDIHLSTPACVQPTTTTVAPTTTTQETVPSTTASSSTTTAPPTSTSAPATSTTAVTTAPSTTASSTTAPPESSSPTTSSPPSSAPATSSPPCAASSRNSNGPLEASTDCGEPSQPQPSTPPANPSPGDSPTNSSTTSSDLPTTGPDDAGTLALIALAALAGGAALIAAARRRGVS